MNTKRFYNFIVIIYEDDENFDKQYFNLTQENEAIWIRHDQDLDDEGNIKKAHYHFIVKMKNACTISALAKRFEVNENLIEPVKRSLNGSLKYLIHYGYDNKFQYDVNLVESNSQKLKRKFLDLVTKDVPEVDKVICIQEYIDNLPDYVKISVLSKYVQKNNLWDVFRRNYSIIKDLVNEHNGKVSGELYGYKYENEDFYR